MVKILRTSNPVKYGIHWYLQLIMDLRKNLLLSRLHHYGNTIGTTWAYLLKELLKVGYTGYQSGFISLLLMTCHLCYLQFSYSLDLHCNRQQGTGSNSSGQYWVVMDHPVERYLSQVSKKPWEGRMSECRPNTEI